MDDAAGVVVAAAPVGVVVFVVVTGAAGVVVAVVPVAAVGLVELGATRALANALTMPAGMAAKPAMLLVWSLSYLVRMPALNSSVFFVTPKPERVMGTRMSVSGSGRETTVEEVWSATCVCVAAAEVVL